MTASDRARTSYAELLRRPGVPALLLSATSGRLAGRMFVLAIVLFTLERFHSPVLAGWVTFALMAPGVVASPLAGALLDRLGAASAIAIDNGLTALLVGVLVLAAGTGVLGPAGLVGVVGLASLSSPLTLAGVRALIPRLVPTAALPRANALDTGSFALVDVAGPALGGVLVGLIGAVPTLLLIAALYAAAALLLGPVLRAPVQGPVHRGPLLRSAWEGLLFVLGDRTLRGIAAGYSSYQMTWGLLLVAVPVLIVHRYGAGGEVMVGWLWAVFGVSAAIGSVIAGHLQIVGRERGVMIVTMLVTAIAMVLPAAFVGLPGLVPGLVLAGLVAGPGDVGVLTLRQRVTPPHRLGRVLAVSISLSVMGTPVGAALGGVLAKIDPAWAFAAAAIVPVIGAGLTWLLVPRSPATTEPTSR